ncbi:MAG: YlbE-like family protein [Bacilli bacterium]
MTLEIQFKLKNNPLYLKYLHESSNWYKILNRNPERINDFIEEMKVAYKLRPQDRIDKVMNAIDILNVLMQMK